MKKLIMVAVLALAGCTMPPKPQRADVTTEGKAVAGLEVAVQAMGDRGWNVAVKNNLADTVSIVWDESTFVESTGLSRGRLIRGDTRVMNVDREQPRSPVAPGATVSEWCIPEGYTTSSGIQYGVHDAAGQLFIVFETADGKQTWQGTVTIQAPAPAAAP